jgi:hemerythrin-like domain-containing protein
MRTARREFLAAAAGIGCLGWTGTTPVCAAQPAKNVAKSDEEKRTEQGAASGEDVSAPEDLMREHGVLRRILLVYQEGLRRLRVKQAVPPDVFQESAGLIRKFVEDYHEKLEEHFIFPLFEKHHELLPLINTLRKQHAAGRVLTDVVLGHAAANEFSKDESQKTMIQVCSVFIRMYGPHAAREDTVLFPALHKILTAREMDKLGDQFEDEENRLFGKNGFEHTVDQVAALEKQLGIFDLDFFTPKP